MRPLCLSLLLPLILVSRAFAQAPDAGGPTVEPRSANPGGADDPAELLRASGLGDVGSDDAGTLPPVMAEVLLPPTDAGAPAGDGDDVTGKIGAAVRLSYQHTGAFPVDETGTIVTPGQSCACSHHEGAAAQ